MKVGIVGYSGSGKTTIFNALTGAGSDTSPGRPGRLNLREVIVPDERIDKFVEMYQPKKTTYASIQLADMPGQAPGSGGGFDPQTIAKMREMDLLVLVLRAFKSPFVTGKPKPLEELGSLLAEVLISDITVIEKKLDRLRRERKDMRLLELFEKMAAHLEEEQPLSTLELSPQELENLSGFRFLTLKPVLVLVNTPEDMADEESASELLEQVRADGLTAFSLSGQLEAEIAELDEDDQKSFLADLGITETARTRFIQAAYARLDLISFMTVGEDEVRAWTVRRGSNAQEAAGKIHTDLARTFIRAERMRTEDLLELGSEAAVKDAGKFELKGRDYIVEDGDILHIRANA